MKKIKNFFYAKSICLAGASSKEKSIGYEILKNIIDYGYKGNIYPVNPKGGVILGRKCYASVGEIADNIDLAIVVVPKQFAAVTVDSLLRKGVKSIVLITAGFRETGEEGSNLEMRIVKKIKDAGACLVGPNCMGVINTHESVLFNATFVAEHPEPGGIGFLSQSGALGAAVLNSLRETDIRLAHFISVGNKADINENDIVRYWQTDDNIKTIALYLESFENGTEFIKLFAAGEITKPVIVLKSGRTSGGMKAASSHTGAMGSKDKVVDALLSQFGVMRVNDINELFNTAKGFEYFPMPKGNRVAVITNAGGPAILAVDALEKRNLVLSEFSSATKEKLKEVVNPDGSVENPVDLLPGADAKLYRQAAAIVLEDNNVDAVISIFVQPVMIEPMEVIESVYSITDKTRKPILQVCMPLPEFWEEYRKNSAKRLPVFRNPEEPAAIISNMLLYSKRQETLVQNRSELVNRLNQKPERISRYKRGFLSQKEALEICSCYGLPVVESRLVEPSKLSRVENEKFPLVVKGINRRVIHKSEFDAVKVNIRNRDELLKCAGEIKAGFNRNGYEVEEFLLQPYIEIKHELLLGGFRDPSFGPVIMFGTGGKYVEIINDVAMKSALLTYDDIDEMIEETAAGKILKGVRGEAGIDMTELKKIVYSASQMMIDNNSISEFDFNPLVVDAEQKLHIVDVRIKID